MKHHVISVLILLIALSCSNEPSGKKPILVTFTGKLLDAHGESLYGGTVKIFDGGDFLKNKETAKHCSILSKDGSFACPINIKKLEEKNHFYILYEKENHVSFICTQIVILPKNPSDKDKIIGLEDVQLYAIDNIAHDKSNKKIKVYSKPSLKAEMQEFETDKYIVLKHSLGDSIQFESYKNDKLLVASGQWIEILCSKDMKHTETKYIFYNDALTYRQAVKCYEPYIRPVKSCYLYASADESTKKTKTKTCTIDENSGIILADEVVYDNTIKNYWYRVSVFGCQGWIKGDLSNVETIKKEECENRDLIWSL